MAAYCMDSLTKSAKSLPGIQRRLRKPLGAATVDSTRPIQRSSLRRRRRLCHRYRPLLIHLYESAEHSDTENAGLPCSREVVHSGARPSTGATVDSSSDCNSARLVQNVSLLCPQLPVAFTLSCNTRPSWLCRANSYLVRVLGVSRNNMLC